MRFSLFASMVCILALLCPTMPSGNTVRPGQPPEPQQETAPQPQKTQPESQAAPAPEETGEAQKAPSPAQEETAAAPQEKPSTPEATPGEKGAAPEAAPAPQTGKPAAEQAVPEQAGAGDDKVVSIASLANKRPDATGKPLVIPEEGNDISFLDGEWMFDKELKGSNGETLSLDFSAKDGLGTAVMVDDKNNRFEAPMRAKLEDGVLQINTGKFTSSTSSENYNPEYIECRNGPNGAECSGSDGFGEWKGEHVLQAGAQSKQQKQAGASQASSAQADAARASSAAKFSQAASDFNELAAEGAELPPDVMEKSEKASMSKSGSPLAGLAGDWRYSQDLARKADGAGVSMQFHFDENGKGYSIIKDGSEKDFRADAAATLMKDGSIRVKTDAYQNGSGKAYYPTFMECKGRKGQELDCNVSNGWMRSENGRLVDLNSYKKNAENVEMQELLPTVPAAENAGAEKANAEKAKAEKADANEVNMDDVFAQAAEEVQKSYAGSQQQASGSQQKSTSSQQKSSSRASKDLQLPAKGNSVSFMEGKWICNTGLYSTSDGQPVILEFSFDKNGKGTSFIRERKTGQLYRASARASFRNGILRVNTSKFVGKGHSYAPNYIQCRNNAGHAQCTGKNSNIVWDAAFERK